MKNNKKEILCLKLNSAKKMLKAREVALAGGAAAPTEVPSNLITNIQTFKYFRFAQLFQVKMKTKMALCLLFLARLSHGNYLHSFFTYPPQQQGRKVAISSDGNLYVVGKINYEVEIYVRNSIKLANSIKGQEQIVDIFISQNKSRIYIIRSTAIEVYDGTSQSPLFTISPNVNIKICKITPDENNLIIVPDTPGVINFKHDKNKGFLFYENIVVGGQSIHTAYLTKNNRYLVTGGSSKFMKIYERKLNSSYSLISQHDLSFVIKIVDIFITDDLKYVAVTNHISCWMAIRKKSPKSYSLVILNKFELPPILKNSKMKILSLHVSPNAQVLVLAGVNGWILFSYNKTTNSFQPRFSQFENCTYSFSGTPYFENAVLCTSDGRVIDIQEFQPTFNCYLHPYCMMCINHTICLACSFLNKTTSSGVKCLPPRIDYCLDSILDPITQRCEVYCSPECLQCEGTFTNCTVCADLYKMNKDNKCVLKFQSIQVAGTAMSLLTLFRIKKIKFLFVLIDDLWLYQYHKYDYKEETSSTLSSIRFIQNEKSAFLGLNRLPFLSQMNNVPAILNLKNYANKRFLNVERKADSIHENLIEFFAFQIPGSLILLLLLRILFQYLYNHKASKHFRIFSFSAVFFVMIFDGNIEYISFLAFRHFTYLFSFSFFNKMLSSAIIAFVFVVVVFSLTFYSMTTYLYSKFSKYFLDNLFRINGSHWMMTVVYGVRPFIRGMAHSVIYQRTTLLLLCLTLIDLVVLIVILSSNIFQQFFKSQMVLLCDCVYYMLAIPFHFALYLSILGTGSENPQREQMVEISDMVIFIILIVRLLLLVCRFVFDVLELYLKAKPEASEQNNKGKVESGDKVSVLQNTENYKFTTEATLHY